MAGHTVGQTLALQAGVADAAPIDVIVSAVPALERFARGDLIAIDSGALSPPGRSRRPDGDGRITALRGVVNDTSDPAPIDLISPVLAAPSTVGSPASFPLATLVTSAVTAAVAALFFSPIFAVLAGVSALAMVGRWAGSKLRSWRHARRRAVAVEFATNEWDELRTSWLESAALIHRARWLEPDQLDRSRDRSPWSRRLMDGDDLPLVLGRGSFSVPIGVDTSGADSIDPAIIGASPVGDLHDVPAVRSLGSAGALAICGDRGEILASARWVVMSTSMQVGPADLGLVVITTTDRVIDWDWCKWLPSLRACVVVDVDSPDQWVDSLAVGPPCLVVVDGAEPTTSRPLARLLAGRVESARLLWLGAEEDVPGGCAIRLTVRADGAGLLHEVDGAANVAWHGLDEASAQEAARWLAPFDDPEVDDSSARLPQAIALSDLLDQDSILDDGAALARCWDLATNQSLPMLVGVDVDGRHVVDLVAEGPHALVAGTTGAGKSELLRTLVVSLAAALPPDLVSFVLIDFKGGGAFDAVASLPHVAAVVTDLDPVEASRALRGLRAELLDREHRLRDMACSDVAEIDRAHPRAFGRMVVVVDEFAALADELPDFLDGLVDIARRGRSLGVHLVLATQRPSGVVTGQIRSNTNLRICLRVQDRADSVDVIDRPDAALLPAVPGRAIVQRGGGVSALVQVAHINAPSAADLVSRFVVHRCVPESSSQRTALTRIGAWCGDVSRAVGIRSPEPRRPSTRSPASQPPKAWDRPPLRGDQHWSR